MDFRLGGCVIMKNKFLKIFCMAAMVFSSIMIIPKMVEAKEVKDGEIIYTDEYAIGDYWSERKAPIKEDYVFGGWYKEIGDAYEPLTANEAEETETAYAKFVPAYVLSVKAQNEANVTADTDNTSVRIITSLDSKQYKKVGFDIWLANKKQLFKEDNTALETTRVYEGVMVGDTPKDADVLFGTASQYVGVWELTNIAKSNYNKIIYVRPYWITMDGTKVEGLAKYVHIEDDYKELISVPVNLLEEDLASQVAAGALDVTYSNASNTILELVDVEAGRILPEMSSKYTDKTIKIVGNTNSEIGEYRSGECIYANLRFKKPTVNTEFNMELGKFCDWNEQDVNVQKVWDIKYVQQNSNE